MLIQLNILTGGRGGKNLYIDIKKEGAKTDPHGTSKLASLAPTSCVSEASIFDKLHNHLDHVVIRKKSQQLTSKAAVSSSVINRCQVDKHGTGLLLSLKRVLDILQK